MKYLKYLISVISGEVKKRLWCFDDAEWIKRITSSKMCLVGRLL